MYWKSAQMNFYKKSGVGSNVVCSTLIGSARASTRGMDNGDVPRLNLNIVLNYLCVSVYI